MPTLSNIKENRTKKTFKKREYRPWNLEGNQKETSSVKESSPPPPVTKNVIDETINDDTIVLLDVSIIKNWEYHDRPANELGDIEELAKEFKTIGQQQPCIVRKIEDTSSNFKYELIVGERRWEAAKLAKTKLKAIIRKLSDSDAALIQASENSSRQDLSDYAKGMSYHKLIDNDIISKKELSDKLNISRQRMARFLSFSNLPSDLTNHFTDFSKISAGTAEKMLHIANKGKEYIEAIILYKDRIQKGELGHNKLSELVERHVTSKEKPLSKNEKIYSNNGKHLYTWRYDNNNLPSIHFPKNVIESFSKEEINNELKRLVNELLLKNRRPTGGTIL